MNKQNPPHGIEWTRVWGRNGYTWNPIVGCNHGCKWQMPNGEIAACYAETLVETRLQDVYTKGFATHYWFEKRLQAPLKVKKGAGIFIGSIADLMGREVPAEQVQAVLDVCREAEQHIFFLLTKNAPRLRKFNFPANVWVGVSSPPDWYRGKQLNGWQRSAMLQTSLKALRDIDARVKWMSFEPLSWNVSHFLWGYPDVLDWAVIGAASNGKQLFPPDEKHFRDLMSFLNLKHIPVFFKGNLRSLPIAAQNWREDFPPQYETVAQGKLF
ncbi:MAG: phage Gp37/Gp68 family protein [Anaerolineae bacterium]|nr:phage Gp37/Gp68 family protein [Anaerolineae bacterium]